MITVALLGPLEIHRDGRPLTVPSGKTAEVLVRLALEAGRVVRADRLIEDLWGAATGLNTLQSKVSQLRRALGDPALVVARDGGYLLAVPAEQVDALRVPGLAAAVGAARRSGDAPAALTLAAEALELFRGELPEGDWLQPHRVRLGEIRLGLIEDLAAARVDAGAGGEVIGELEALVEQHPLREGLWHTLITALYRAGRQADALAAYARVRRLLVEELGVDPGPELRTLESRILRQSPALAAAPQAGNLPALSSPLVGRGAELADLDELVRDRRLVTVVGSAGVGKTRLAIEVARRLRAPGGVWLVRLDAADATTSIRRLIAETLRVAPADLDDRLAGAETVLVLDNCEHLVEPVAALTGRLLDAADGLRVLATSQLPLGLDGEVVVPLEPLTIADSVELFAARALQTRRQFVLDAATRETVAEVCRSLDGLPLAIELAAARIKSLSVREIARRLDDRFVLLRDPASRRRSLAGAIAWSYDLLFPDDQRGLWALSIFAGGAPLAAAEHVLAALGVPASSAVDVVGRLVDRSLVSVEFGDAGRYRLLDSIRAFAAARMREAGVAEVAGAAHASWFAAEAARQSEVVRGAAQAECVAFARAERANIDTALAWCAEHDPGLGVRIVNGFGWTWVVLGDGVAGAARVRAALASAPLAFSRPRFDALLLAGWLEASAGDVALAAADLDEALELAGHLELLVADAQRHLAFLRIQQGRPHEVLSSAAASRAVYRPLGLAWETAASLLLTAFGSIMLGDTAAATRAAGEAARLIGPIGDSWALVHAEGMLGAIAQAEHRLDDAARSLSRAAAESERLGFLGQAALHLTSLGRVQQRAGLSEAAADTLNRAIEAARKSSDPRITATARVHLARIHLAAGDDDSARGQLELADRWYRTAGGDGALLTRCLLATTTTTTASTASTAEELEAVLADAQLVAHLEVQVLASDALARLAAQQGDLDAARARLAAADELAAAIRHVLDDGDRTDARRARDAISTCK